MRNHPLSLSLLFLSACLMSACGTSSKAPPIASDDPQHSELQEGLSPILPEAVEAEKRGEFESAARLYLEAAEISPTQTQHTYQLKAITLLLKGNFLAQASRLAHRLSGSKTLSESQTTQLTLLQSQIAVAQQNPDQALQYLSTLPSDNLTRAEKRTYLQLKADAHKQRHESEEAFLALSQTLALTDDSDNYANVENNIWAMLIQLSPESLSDLRLRSDSPETLGWLDLAEIYHGYNSLSSRMDLDIAAWLVRYPNHPASPQLLDSIKALQNDILFKPQVIALLLPDGGPFAKPAAAIKTGFIAAFMARADESYTPEIRFYDSGELADQTLNAYDRAVLEGAELIVGPLSKNNVSTLAQRETLPIPTLALNSIELEHAVDNLYLFGLNPEDEAKQVAEKAWLDGYNQALSLIPKGKLGERLGRAFSETWRAFGGKTMEQQQFDPTAQDFSRPLQALLNLDESKARIRAIKNLLGHEVRTEPRRRQDVDFIFLTAQPQQARQIRPQLKFFYAGNIPVYATSHVFTGSVNPRTDHDMNDILFCDMPWVLDSQPLWEKIHANWPNQSSRYKRLYALGVDSFDIIAHLRRLSAYKFQQFPGRTGLLSLDNVHHIKRKLRWARFVNGRPVPLASQQSF